MSSRSSTGVVVLVVRNYHVTVGKARCMEVAHLIRNREIANFFLGQDPFYEYNARRMIKKIPCLLCKSIAITETTKPRLLTLH